MGDVARATSCKSLVRRCKWHEFGAARAHPDPVLPRSAFRFLEKRWHLDGASRNRNWRRPVRVDGCSQICDSPQAVEYTLDGGPRQIALYQADGYLSFVPPEFVVQSLEELERRVGHLPAGSRLHWQPCKRDPSGKPTLLSDGQYDLFEKFCRDRKIELLISRSPCNGKSG